MYWEMPMTVATQPVSPDAIVQFSTLLGKHASGWVFLVPVVIVLIFLVLVRHRHWINFTERRKKTSRAILFVLTSFVAFSLWYYAYVWAFQYIPMKFSYEKPHLTATAIKLGLYGLFMGHELELRLPPEKKELLNCVQVISYWETHDYHGKCNVSDRACLNSLPPLMTRDAIIAKIKASQTSGLGEASKACKNIDVTKLQ